MKNESATILSRVRVTLLMLILPFLAFPQRAPAQPDLARLLSLIGQHRTHQQILNAPNGRGPKCGLSLTFEILAQWDRLSMRERELLKEALLGPVSQKDRVIGHFRFYYDTTGNDAPTLLDEAFNPIPGTSEAFVDSAGQCFNQAWDFEIGTLGYLQPPLEPDSTYHVTIRVLGAGLYGETLPELEIDPGPPPRSRTTIEIDNGFRYVYPSSRGIPGLKVTAAHEFHHAIQIGSYAIWDADRYFYEITSTWMESMVFPEVHDYFQYLANDAGASSQFSHPETRFTAADGSIEYSRCVWGIFIAKRFSPAVMRRTWETMTQLRSLEALNVALSEVNSSFRSAYIEYAYWNANTGITSDTSAFYSSGRDYPRMALSTALHYIPPKLSVDAHVQPLGSSYMKIYLPHSTAGSDSMVVIITNVNTSKSYSDQDQLYSYVVTGQPSAGTRQLSNGYSVSLVVPDPQNWNSQESVPAVIQNVEAYPDPFMASTQKILKFLLPVRTQEATAGLKIYNSAMEQMFSGDVPVVSFRPLESGLTWDGTDEHGNRIATGIYIFVISVDGRQYVGKFSAIR